MSELRDSDVIVVGAGPSGIAAAVALRKRGVLRVDLVERDAVPGGVPRHCGHPPFGLREFGRIYTGPQYARRLAQLAEQYGVRIHTGVTVVKLEEGARLHVASREGTSTLTAKRIVLATGVRETPRSARLVSGDRPIGVFNTGALQAFVYLRNLVPFRRPLIVGTELVAISAILTCLKAGIRPVCIVEENDRPTTYRPFALFPRVCGVPVLYGTHIEEILGSKRVEAVRLRMSDGSIQQVICDGVLFTGKFTPESSLIRNSHLILDPGTNGPQVDQYGRCSDPAFYAAGNVLRPLETAGWSYREGTRIGNVVADDLRGLIPLTGPTLLVERSEDIKFAMPQRLLIPAMGTGFEDIQLRVAHEVRGTLDVSVNGTSLWSKSMHMLPDRRLLIPLRRLQLPEHAEAIRIAVRPNPN